MAGACLVPARKDTTQAPNGGLARTQSSLLHTQMSPS